MTERERTALEENLERGVLFEILQEWRSANSDHFYGTMRPPTFELSDAGSYFGRWLSASRTISISRELVFDYPWHAVEEVLKHEMAHQFVDEVLNTRDETAHGPAFRSVCQRLGIDPAASGPLSAAAGAELDGASARIVEKISRLLTLAGSPNQHEAEAATLAARRLMAKHNLDCAALPKRYAYKRLGEPTGRVEESAKILGGILTEHFFVQGIWVFVYLPREMRKGRVLEILGTPENLAIAEFVHAFLTRTAESLWQTHRDARGLRSNRDRRTFHSGVMIGFREKLRSEQQTPEGRGLVWVKSAELDEYYRRRYPRVAHSTSGGRQRNESFFEGRAAGKKIVLSKPVEATVSARGRLLGDGKK